MDNILNETLTLMGMYEEQSLQFDYLTTTLFPADKIYTENCKMLVDIKDGDNRIAPFISPMSAGKVMTRKGFRTYEVDAPYIGVKRPISMENLKYRSFGQDFQTVESPEQKAARLRTEDLQYCQKAIARAIEKICASVAMNLEFSADVMAEDGKTILKQNFKFYEGETAGNKYVPANKWSDANADILGDIRNMKVITKKSGNAGNLLIMNSATAMYLLKDENIRSLLDNRNINVGTVEPNDFGENFEETLGVLRAPGAVVNVVTYDGFYVDENGKEQLYIPDGKVLLTSPGAGKTDYAAVTQKEQGDSQWHTYGGILVPKHLDDPVGNTESLQVVSRPLPMPKTKNAFIVAEVL